MTNAFHVAPTAGGAWVVRRDPDPAPLSRHASETEAERAAARHAAADDDAPIFVHDRYHRVRRRFTRDAERLSDAGQHPVSEVTRPR